MFEILREIGLFFSDPIARGMTFIGGTAGVGIGSIIWNSVKTAKVLKAAEEKLGKTSEDVDLLVINIGMANRLIKQASTLEDRELYKATLAKLQDRLAKATSVVEIKKVEPIQYD